MKFALPVMALLLLPGLALGTEQTQTEHLAARDAKFVISEAVRTCFRKAKMIEDAEACVGVSVLECLNYPAATGTEPRLACVYEEAVFWETAQFKLELDAIMNRAPSGSGESFVAEGLADLEDWRRAVAVDCGPVPKLDGPVAPAAEDILTCRAVASARRIFLLLESKEE